MENEQWEIENCIKEIKKLFDKFDYNKDYEKFKKEPTVDNLYSYVISWNSGIGILKSKKNVDIVKSLLNEIIQYKKPQSLNEEKEFLKEIIILFKTDKLGNRNFKIPALKIAHILYPDVFPIIDNHIKKELIGTISLNIDQFIDFVFIYRDCLNDILPYNIDFKTFDEFMFLVYSKKEDKLSFSYECYDFFDSLKREVKKCVKEKFELLKLNYSKSAKIGIMCAMREELEPILKEIEVKEVVEYARNRYYLATFNNLDLVLAYSKIGKVNAATTASVLIEKFGAKKILFSGVAGAIDADLKIGDLIIATKTCQHDVDLTVFGYEPGFIPESKVFFECDENLNNIAKKVAEKLDIKLKEGIIATGDQFIHSKERKEWIAKTFNASAIEMEGGAVGCVAWTLDVPFFMLRSISDTAQEGAGVDFDEFLEKSSEVSAKFLIEMLREMGG